MNIEIIKEYNLSRYFVKVYKLQNNSVNMDQLNNLENELDQQEYAKDIVFMIENIENIKTIEVYDLNHNLLIRSSNESLSSEIENHE